MTVWRKKSKTDWASDISPEPMATARTPKVNTAPVASLKADLLITVCATRSFTWTCLKTGTSVAGSVEAIAAPSRRATIGGRSSRIWAAAAVTRAVDDNPRNRQGDDGDPHPLQDGEPQRRAAVKQKIGGAENQDGLVKRTVRRDDDQIKQLRPDKQAGQQKDGDIRHPDFP